MYHATLGAIPQVFESKEEENLNGVERNHGPAGWGTGSYGLLPNSMREEQIAGDPRN
jgi:hypothetical protein